VIVALAGLTSGCGGSVEQATGMTSAGLGCGDFCGGVKQLKTDGGVNAAGVRLMGIDGSKHGRLRPFVNGDHLGGVDTDGTIYYDRELIFSRLHVKAPAGEFDIEIFDADDPPLWTTGGEPGHGYRLRYQQTDGDVMEEWKPLCSDATSVPIWGPSSGLAIIFAGDDVDDTLKLVSANEDGVTFNLACAGDPIAGMYMAGHSAASDPDNRTTEPDRQAMLKMLAGDYCGSGVSYSFDLPPARFVDATQLLPPLTKAPTSKTLEAIWTSKGALCVENPRSPAMTHAIGEACQLPRCSSLSPDGVKGVVAHWQQLGHVLSANAP
jgi:hypothetical protein